jgi:predicted ABC-type ATPase
MKGDLRLRIFAGPNGSGKSTIFQEFKRTIVHGYPLDLGIYINPDEITLLLKQDNFIISNYNISISKRQFIEFAANSGLLRKLTPKILPKVFSIYV